MSDIYDILYTPLDVASTPEVDCNEIRKWCNLNSFRAPARSMDLLPELTSRGLDIAEGSMQLDSKRTNGLIDKESNYPWNLTYAMFCGEWYGGFDTKFPELVTHFYNLFGLTQQELGFVILLPIHPTFQGRGFWHSDPDLGGLRLYLEIDDVLDSLLIKPTIVKRSSEDIANQMFQLAWNKSFGNDLLQYAQPTMHSAIIKNTRQAYFINNVNAFHAVNVKTYPARRIAVILGTLAETQYIVPDKIKQLILDSAATYKNQAIYWTPPVD